MGYLSDVEILGIARDIDQGHDVKNWVKSIIKNAGFNVKEDDKFLIVEDLNLKIAVLGIGNYDEDDFNIPSFVRLFCFRAKPKKRGGLNERTTNLGRYPRFNHSVLS